MADPDRLLFESEPTPTVPSSPRRASASSETEYCTVDDESKLTDGTECSDICYYISGEARRRTEGGQAADSRMKCRDHRLYSR